MMNMIFNDFSDLLWNSWPSVKAYKYEIKPEMKKSENAVDTRLEWFKCQSYNTMDAAIKDLEVLLVGMKELRKTKLDKEIADTEERLKNLKENL